MRRKKTQAAARLERVPRGAGASSPDAGEDFALVFETPAVAVEPPSAPPSPKAADQAAVVEGTSPRADDAASQPRSPVPRRKPVQPVAATIELALDGEHFGPPSHACFEFYCTPRVSRVDVLVEDDAVNPPDAGNVARAGPGARLSVAGDHFFSPNEPALLAVRLRYREQPNQAPREVQILEAATFANGCVAFALPELPSYCLPFDDDVDQDAAAAAATATDQPDGAETDLATPEPAQPEIVVDVSFNGVDFTDDGVRVPFANPPPPTQDETQS